MKRQISGLKSAVALVGRPKCIPLGRPRGQKAWGIRYEREIAKRLPMASKGMWFKFEDRNGPGFCQVDFLLSLVGYMIVLESKYTWTLDAHVELETLYLPVVEMALRQKTQGVVVCKSVTVQTPKHATIYGDLTEISRGAGRPVWHFLGKMAPQPSFSDTLSVAEQALGFDTLV